MFVLISDVSDNEDDSENEENNKNSRNSRNNAAGIKGQKNIKDCFVSLKMEKGGDIKSKTKTEKVTKGFLFYGVTLTYADSAKFLNLPQLSRIQKSAESA